MVSRVRNVTIKAKVDGKKFKCKIKVVDKPTINTKKKTLKVGKIYILKITGTNKKVKWTSSNKKVATVNSNGKVTAKKKGTAIITAKVGNKKITCKITVKNDDVLKVIKPSGEIRLINSNHIIMVYFTRRHVL